jgi:hypothetical protein
MRLVTRRRRNAIVRWVIAAAFSLAMPSVRSPRAAAIVAFQPAAALAGTWELNRELTDRPEQVAASIRADLGPAPSEQRFGDMTSGRSGRGGRRGGAEPRSGSRDQTSRQEQEQIDALSARLRYPPTRLTIAQSGSSITLSDPQSEPRTIDPSGKKTTTTIGGASIDVTARYEGPQLIVTEDLGKGQTMTWSYSVLPATKQLLVRVTIARGPLQTGPFEIKYVYDSSGGG